MSELTVRRRGTKHAKMQTARNSKAKRKIIRAGRRGGKTVGVSQMACDGFMSGKRVLYGAPTTDQLRAFWSEIVRAFADGVATGVLRKNESEHFIEIAGTKHWIRAKTVWDADTLRGDYADLLILDECQMIDESAWTEVGLPMLADNNGDAVLIYTPPSVYSLAESKAKDPRWISRLFEKALTDPRWEAFHFSSHDNPYISREGLEEIAKDMTALAYRQEILAEDIDEVPGALWNRISLDLGRLGSYPDLDTVAVGVDPPGGATECGMVVAGAGVCTCKGWPERHGFVIEDASLKADPNVWASEISRVYHEYKADVVVGEKNFGGDMVRSTILTADSSIAYSEAHASRGKAVRAEPIAALYEQNKVHHVGVFPKLEDEMVSWVPGLSQWSPNRLDALVWALTRCRILHEAHRESAPPDTRTNQERFAQRAHDRWGAQFDAHAERYKSDGRRWM